MPGPPSDESHLIDGAQSPLLAQLVGQSKPPASHLKGVQSTVVRAHTPSPLHAEVTRVVLPWQDLAGQPPAGSTVPAGIGVQAP